VYVRSSLVEMIDFSATLYPLAGAELGHRLFGRSLVSLLGQPVQPPPGRGFRAGAGFGKVAS